VAGHTAAAPDARGRRATHRRHPGSVDAGDRGSAPVGWHWGAPSEWGGRSTERRLAPGPARPRVERCRCPRVPHAAGNPAVSPTGRGCGVDRRTAPRAAGADTFRRLARSGAAVHAPRGPAIPPWPRPGRLPASYWQTNGRMARSVPTDEESYAWGLGASGCGPRIVPAHRRNHHRGGLFTCPPVRTSKWPLTPDARVTYSSHLQEQSGGSTGEWEFSRHQASPIIRCVPQIVAYARSPSPLPRARAYWRP